MSMTMIAMMVLCPFRLLSENATHQVAYPQQKLAPHGSGGQEVQGQGPADSVSGSQMVLFSSVLTWQKSKAAPLGSRYNTDTNSVYDNITLMN